jgi:hypothetical protein
MTKFPSDFPDEIADFAPLSQSKVVNLKFSSMKNIVTVEVLTNWSEYG